MMKGKYCVISSISVTISRKQRCKKNTTKDTEIKNKLTVTREEGEEGIMGGSRGRAIKEHVLRAHGQSQRGWVQGWEAGMGGVWGVGR